MVILVIVQYTKYLFIITCIVLVECYITTKSTPIPTHHFEMRSSSEPRELRFLEKKRTWIRVSDWDEHREFILGLVESKKSQPDILQILGQAGISMK